MRFSKFFSARVSYLLFLFFMNSMFPAKRAKLFEFQTLRMRFFVLICRVISTAASHALKLYEFSHMRVLPDK